MPHFWVTSRTVCPLFSMLKLLLSQNNGLKILRKLSYVQGQSPEPKVREYFYYIDHQGMLFLDDSKMKNFTSCFKDKKFLAFFFRHLRFNTTSRYPEFPYLSPCGKERNFVRCEDLPIVFTHLSTDENNNEYIHFGHAGNLLKIPFQPSEICMLPQTGRVYHPAMDKIGGVGLIRSCFAIELSKHFIFPEDSNESTCPKYFEWKNKRYTLTHNLLKVLK